MAQPACPKCGDSAHIYARADIRWNPEAQTWDIGDIEDQLECTECDATFYAPEDWPQPDARQWPCPYCDGATEHATGCEMLATA